jgi:hypothetical protein
MMRHGESSPKGLDARPKGRSLGCGADGAIILDILNLIGRFFKFGMETKQFPRPDWPQSDNCPSLARNGVVGNSSCLVGIASRNRALDGKLLGSQGAMSGYRVSGEIGVWGVVKKMSRPARGAWIETKLV